MLGTITSTELVWFKELRVGELFRFAGQVSTYIKTGYNSYRSVSWTSGARDYFATDSELTCRVGKSK